MQWLHDCNRELDAEKKQITEKGKKMKEDKKEIEKLKADTVNLKRAAGNLDIVHMKQRLLTDRLP